MNQSPTLLFNSTPARSLGFKLGFSRFLAAPLLSVAALTLCTSTSNAVLLAYDGFDYATGALAGNAGGTGWTGAWTGGNQVSTGSLTYGSLATAGNQALLNGAGGSAALRTLSSSYTTASGTDYWISFTINVPATSTDVGISLFEGSGGERNFMGVSSGINNNYGLLQPTLNTAVARGTGTHFYVLQYAASGAVNLWLDPDQSSLGGAAPTGGTNVSGTRGSFTFNTIRLGSFNGTGAVDELRIGTTFAAVSPIPEPSTFGLLAIGALGLARRRR